MEIIAPHGVRFLGPHRPEQRLGVAERVQVAGVGAALMLIGRWEGTGHERLVMFFVSCPQNVYLNEN